MALVNLFNQNSGPHVGSGSQSASVTVQNNGALILCLVSTATAGDSIGSVTFDGVSLTQVQSAITGTNRNGTLWYLENVSAKTANLTVNPSSIGNRYSFCWTVVDGIATSSPLNASAKGSTTTASSVTGTLTPGQANSFVVMMNFNMYDPGTNSSWIAATGDDQQMFFYDGAPASSFSMTQTSSSTDTNWIMASFTQISTVIGPAGVKTVMGVDNS